MFYSTSALLLFFSSPSRLTPDPICLGNLLLLLLCRHYCVSCCSW